MAYTPDPDNLAEPTSGRSAGTAAAEFRAIKQKIAGIISGTIFGVGTLLGQQGLVDYIHVDHRFGHRDLIADGWYPAFFNQQWGGTPHYYELVDGATGVLHKFEALNGYIDDNQNVQAVGAAAGGYYNYQSFYSGKAQNLKAIWVKVYKEGNPTDNLTLTLWSVAAGTPNAVIATANVISGRQIISDNGQPTGAFYRFEFAVAQALAANTQYIYTLHKSAGVDAVNFYRTKLRVGTKFPSNLQGVGTSAPVWTPTNTQSQVFICETESSNQSITTGGVFNDGKYTFFEGNPVTHSNARCKDLKDFKGFSVADFTLTLFGGGWTKDKTILDILYGPHHDRIVLRSAAATGFATLTIYESDGTVTTVTGTTDISTAANKMLTIRVRANNDGADVAQIWVNATKEAEVTAQSFIFDTAFLNSEVGTVWLGGGFNLASAFPWTHMSVMNTLPSADGWTFTTGTATAEGNAFSVSNGKLNQIRNGYANGGDGRYTKNPAFVNATGWAAVHKHKVIYSHNTKSSADFELRIQDGTREILSLYHEHFVESFGASTINLVQTNGQRYENTYLLTGKSNDALRFKNGKFIEDLTSFMTQAIATNEVSYGDRASAGGENADVLTDYLGYYNAGQILPQATGGALSEFLIWTGDKTSVLVTLYNAGVFLSGKQVFGLTHNRLTQNDLVFSEEFVGITSGPVSSPVTTPSVVAEMEMYVIGTHLDIEFNSSGSSSAGGGITLQAMIDNDIRGLGGFGQNNPDGAESNHTGGIVQELTSIRKERCTFGLHKIDGRMTVSGGNYTGRTVMRKLSVEVRV